ncbi:MAG: SixA phosphatase family protein [Blastocatellia bacterium]
MELYLLRHGIAADLGAGVTRDADRPLTAEGRDKMRQQARGMLRLGLMIDFIFTSPYRRTMETTQVVTEVLAIPPERVFTLPALAAGQPFAQGLLRRAPVFTELGALHYERALVVGHMPDLAEMASVLLCGGGGVYVEFKKGALCAIEIDSLPPRTPGSLLWSLTPKQLRMLG